MEAMSSPKRVAEEYQERGQLKKKSKDISGPRNVRALILRVVGPHDGIPEDQDSLLPLEIRALIADTLELFVHLLRDAGADSAFDPFESIVSVCCKEQNTRPISGVLACGLSCGLTKHRWAVESDIIQVSMEILICFNCILPSSIPG